MVAHHQLQKQDVERLALGGLQPVELLVAGHPRHPPVGQQRRRAVRHPRHFPVRGDRRQVPVLEPRLHLPDLELLPCRDVVPDGPDRLRRALPVREHRHLDGLRVVQRHVPGEARLG
jgi:hypothetical protein